MGDTTRTDKPWTLPELDVFFHQLKVNRRSFIEIARMLNTRSEESVRSLYKRHATYLSLPQSDVQVFRSIVVDAQKATSQIPPSPPASPMIRRQTSAFAPPPSKRAKSNNDTTFSPDEHTAGHALSLLSAMSPPPHTFPGLSRDRIGDVDMSKSVFAPIMSASSSSTPPSSSKRVQSPQIISAIRPTSPFSIPQISSKMDIDGKESSWTPMNKVCGNLYDYRVLDGGDAEPGQQVVEVLKTDLTSKLEKCKTSSAQKNCLYDLFYPVIDQLYFSENSFRHALNQLGFREDVRRTVAGWNQLRRLLPLPRLLSKVWFAEEKQKLQSYRKFVRKNQNISVKNNGIGHTRITEGVSRLLRKNENVLAFHSLTKYVHEGKVISTSPGRYIVKFGYVDLGTLDVSDEAIVNTELSMCSIPAFDYPTNLADAVGMDTDAYQVKAIDALVAAKLLTYLDRKQVLMNHLRRIIALWDKFVNEDCTIPDSVKYQTSWVLFEIERTNMELECSLQFLRSKKMPLLRNVVYDESLLSLELLNQSRRKARDLLVSLDLKLPPRNEISDLLVHSICLVILIRDCAQQKVPPTFVESAVREMRPKCSENAKLFESLSDTIRLISQNLLIPSN